MEAICIITERKKGKEMEEKLERKWGEEALKMVNFSGSL
jgi:hypothetical protein